MSGVHWLIALVLSFGALPAAAQTCAPHEAKLADQLARYNERVVVQARNVMGRLVEITVAPSGTWTILISSQDGTCSIANGVDWTLIK